MNRLDQLDAYARVRRPRRRRADDPRVDGGRGQAWVRLAASAFYPTSGGQPHDLGRLDDAVEVST
jgi:alanyl-tRNA synthetase